MGAKAVEYKFGARAGKHKLGARAGDREIQIPLVLTESNTQMSMTVIKNFQS